VLSWKIVKLESEQFYALDTIVSMKNKMLADKWYEELKIGKRIIYTCIVDGVYAGEVSMVLDHVDPLYVIPGKRVYMQRLIVNAMYRGNGIGKCLVAHLCNEAFRMGFVEVSVSVDKDNSAALHIYRSMGFSNVLFDGEDQYGPCFKLMKKLDDG